MDSTSKKAGKGERLAAALRANLERRKAQARGRAAGEVSDSQAGPAEPDGGE